MAKERLQKVIAHAGMASRRAAEKLIQAGRVTVNDQVVTKLGTLVDSKDRVLVDGVPIVREQLVYYLLNKPRGVISSVHDEKGRKTVVDILRDDGIASRVYPVGRLDYDTTGLLILTNDGEMANQLMHPRFGVEKVYIARVKKVLSNDAMRQLRAGVVIDGHWVRGAKVRLLMVNSDRSWCRIRITIHEGHYHQVKRMLEAVGYSVTKLHRESYGPLNLAGLVSGRYRKLKRDEVQALRRLH